MNLFNPHTSPHVQANLAATPQEWKDQYEQITIRFLEKTQFFDGSLLCANARKEGLAEPHHHNCWVSMIPFLAKKGYIERLPGTTPGSAFHSHNNNVSRWRSLIFKQ